MRQVRFFAFMIFCISFLGCDNRVVPNSIYFVNESGVDYKEVSIFFGEHGLPLGVCPNGQLSSLEGIQVPQTFRDIGVRARQSASGAPELYQYFGDFKLTSRIDVIIVLTPNGDLVVETLLGSHQALIARIGEIRKKYK